MVALAWMVYLIIILMDLYENLGLLFWPILFYGIILIGTGFMSVMLWIEQRTKTTLSLMIGITLLIFSGTLLSNSLFVGETNFLDITTEITYIGSQFFICYYFIINLQNSMEYKTLKHTFILVFLLFCNNNFAQDGYDNDEEYLSPLNDKSLEGQTLFVEELLDLSGYLLKSIEVYQNLPNNAKVFRVKLDSENEGGFVFVRWDKKKKENYVANKMIDPGIYYSLKASKEIMRKQTEKASFGVDDIAIQAVDQEKFKSEEIEQLRQEYDLQQKEKELKKIEQQNKEAKRKKKRQKN